MALKLMYITNDPQIAVLAERCGVDRIFLDMEYLGKGERQPGDTVKSNHTVEDIKTIKPLLTKSEVLVRVNPMTEKIDNFYGSKAEIDDVVAAGADVIMLPMAKTVDEVRKFSEYVGNRTKTVLLLETKEAVEKLNEILELHAVDEIHIGLNDLHLSLNKKFMFELLADGTVEAICNKISSYNIPYGFGGIARLGYGMLPAEHIICEHYRLGSSAAILSRSFANVNRLSDYREIVNVFEKETEKIRLYEATLGEYTAKDFENNRLKTVMLVNEICDAIGG